MCSLFFDGMWRFLGLGREKFSCWFAFTKALVLYDIGSDFYFWYEVRDDDTLAPTLRHAVLALACVGVMVDMVGSCRACSTSVPDSWGKDQDEASNRYAVCQRKVALAMVCAEDVPQLVLSSYITYLQGGVTSVYLATAVASFLNILRVTITSAAYIVCDRRARRIMREEDRSSVTMFSLIYHT